MRPSHIQSSKDRWIHRAPLKLLMTLFSKDYQPITCTQVLCDSSLTCPPTSAVMLHHGQLSTHWHTMPYTWTLMFLYWWANMGTVTLCPASLLRCNQITGLIKALFGFAIAVTFGYCLGQGFQGERDSNWFKYTRDAKGSGRLPTQHCKIGRQ